MTGAIRLYRESYCEGVGTLDGPGVYGPGCVPFWRFDALGQWWVCLDGRTMTVELLHAGGEPWQWQVSKRFAVDDGRSCETGAER